MDIFDISSKEVKEYEYRELPPIKKVINTRQCYIGAERIQDIVNEYEPITYKLPYEIENDWFKITYRIGEGIMKSDISFHNQTYNTPYKFLATVLPPF